MQNIHEERERALHNSIRSLFNTQSGALFVRASNGCRMSKQIIKNLTAWQEGKMAGDIPQLEILEDAILHTLAEKAKVVQDG